MKRLIVEEVNSFRAEVRAQARAASRIPRIDQWVVYAMGWTVLLIYLFFFNSLPIPSREEIISSPVQEHGPVHGATSSYTVPTGARRPPSPVMDDPSAELERELAGKGP